MPKPPAHHAWPIIAPIAPQPAEPRAVRLRARVACGPRLLARFPLLAALALAAPVCFSEPAGFTAARNTFAAEVARADALDAGTVSALLAEARFDQTIIDAMERPYEAKPWRDYRKLFVTPARIAAGVAFRAANAGLLARAEAEYGVDPAIIVAIIGIESRYGARLGDHRALDALATLGFAYPPRAAFFREELEHFLLLTREESIDPRTAMGSYAGALGKPQFIPSSYRNYAVDFDGDGRRDLWGSDADVIGSVANYLAVHGWQRGASIALPALLTRGRPAGITIGNQRPLPPNTTLGHLAGVGITPAALQVAPLPATTAVALLAFDGDREEFLLAFDNFYAITRYNHSNLYARAVLDLGQAIDTAREMAQPQDKTGGNHGDTTTTGGAPRPPG